MAEDSVLNNILSEFKLWGLKPTIEHRNGGHIELQWQVSPDKEPRRTILPKTGSDWRGWLNQRAQVRRMFKQDGLRDPRDTIPKKPEPILQKALSPPPPPPEKPEDQIKSMRCEIADLTELVLELGSLVSKLCDIEKPPVAIAAQAPQPQEPAPPPPPPKRARNTRGNKVIDYLSNNWNSLDAIARDMGLEQIIVKRKLVYLAKNGAVELSDGRWRKTPPPKAETAAVPKAKRKKVNGLSHALNAKIKRNGHSLNGHH